MAKSPSRAESLAAAKVAAAEASAAVAAVVTLVAVVPALVLRVRHDRDGSGEGAAAEDSEYGEIAF